MKLNCDLGESFGNWKMGVDEAVMPVIDMANIACGFHAGDEQHMHKTLLLAKAHHVEVGAHPGYKDIQGFGRRSIAHTEQEIVNLMIYQVSAIIGMSLTLGIQVTYVKPHGALYNDMMIDSGVRTAVFKSIKMLNSSLNLGLKLVMLATKDSKWLKQQAAEYDVELLLEAFADRQYTDDGKLKSRKLAGAVLSKEKMLLQVEQLHKQGTVTTDSGSVLKIDADTICVHGDNEEGISVIRDIKAICQA